MCSLRTQAWCLFWAALFTCFSCSTDADRFESRTDAFPFLFFDWFFAECVRSIFTDCLPFLLISYSLHLSVGSTVTKLEQTLPCSLASRTEHGMLFLSVKNKNRR